MKTMSFVVIAFALLSAGSVFAQQQVKEVDIDPNTKLSDLANELKAGERLVLHVQFPTNLRKDSRLSDYQDGHEVPLMKDGNPHFAFETPECTFISPRNSEKSELFDSGFDLEVAGSEISETKVQTLSDGTAIRWHDFILIGSSQSSPFVAIGCIKFTHADVLSADITVDEVVNEVFKGKVSLKKLVPVGAPDTGIAPNQPETSVKPDSAHSPVRVRLTGVKNAE